MEGRNMRHQEHVVCDLRYSSDKRPVEVIWQSEAGAPAAVPTRDPHAFLRRATARLHRRLDHGPMMAKLTAADCSIVAYRAAMLGLAWAYQTVDLTLLRGVIHQPLGMPAYAARGARLSLDLAALDRPPKQCPHPSQAPLAALPTIDSLPSYLGMRYVVEGSQQGSRFIRRALSHSLGEQLSRVGSFWSPEVPWQDHWPSCLAQLTQLSDPTALLVAARAARHTFRHFIACMEQVQLYLEEDDAP